MNDNIVTYRVYDTLAEAAIARDLLDEAGIPATVSNTLSTLYAPVPVPAGGYRLDVFERDITRIAPILNPPPTDR